MQPAPHPFGDGPDLAVLADLSAHLLPMAEERTVQAHVLGCSECTGVLHALERTGRDLRWLPPIAMPPAVVSRIDAVLAEESKVVSIVGLRQRRKRRQALLGLSAAALLVLGGGGVLIASLDPGSAGPAVSAGEDKSPDPPGNSSNPDLDESTLPDAVTDLVTGGEGDQPLRLEGIPAPQNCVASVQLAGVEQLIGVIEIRYGGRNRDAVFFTTSDPGVARVIVVEDCSAENPAIVQILRGQI